MTAPHPLPVAAQYQAQNSRRSRGHVIVLPGRGEGARLYERLGSRLAYDGYTVTVVDVPPLDDIDGTWIDTVEPWSAHDGGEVTLVGSDSGAVIAALLAARLPVGAVALAGIGGIEAADDPGDDQERLAARSSCPVHRGRLSDGGTDLGATASQAFRPEIAVRLHATTLTVPVLAVHGRADPITPLAEAVASYRALAPAAEIVTVFGGVHDSLNDVTHRSVSAELVQFLERRTRPILERLTDSVAEAAA